MFRFHIWGDRACFVRPEFRRDRISYDVIPPLAARGVIDSIYWSPAIRWHIDRIYVLNPIAFEWASSGSSGEIRQMNLVDVAYLVDAHLTLTAKARSTDHIAQHMSLVRRRVIRQQPYRQPFLGSREYPAQYGLLVEGEVVPAADLRDVTVDLGWMTHDLDEHQPPRLRFFRPLLRNGIIEVGSDDVGDLPV